MRRGSRNHKKITLAIAAVALGVGPLHAQQSQSPSSASGTITLTTGAIVDTNAKLAVTSPGTQLKFSENLRFTVTTANRNNRLTFSGGAALSMTMPPGGGTTTAVTTPQVTLTYGRTAANASFNAMARYWSGDVTTSYDIDPSAATVLVVDDGTLTRTGGTLAVRTGLQAPLTLSFDLSYDNRDYSGTADPSLFDETTTQLGATANMRFSPVMRGVLSARLTDYDASDAASTNTQTTDLDFSLSHDLARGLTLGANVGAQQRDITASGTTTSRSGARAGLSATQAMPRGTVFANILFDQSGPKDRTTLTFGRNLTLPAGAVSASVAATDIQGSGVSLLGNASYNQQLADGSFDLTFSQSIQTNQFDQDILTSRLGLGYMQQVTSTSGLNVRLDLTRSEDGGAGAAPTNSRATLNASYNRNLTPDWDLTVGYTYRLASSPGASNASGNSIYVNVARNIGFNF